ncbi:hypothetical protein TRIUR3_28670 [Triticum urartu]|uniref:Uncharacterized protein n=1 Tax=Triticum urartu TaxID=4572 RepID=M7Z9W9_TRIUA|nr:hypothetical protein TRIUR3_28670 [Triticum urartu]
MGGVGDLLGLQLMEESALPGDIAFVIPLLANNLQWILALVPLIKALQMALSFLFWYSCVHLHTCSLWMSFGVYVTGILFQTASFVSFMLISHGYCIMYERLSIRERRTTAGLGCLLYLSLIGYKAAVPYFTGFLLMNYFASFYIIFRRTSQCLLVLREQLNFVEEEDIHSLHGTLNTKYTMFKRFQGTMQVAAVAFIMVYMRADDTPDNYWFRVLVREWVQFCIFMYIGWNFRIPEASLHLPVMPLMKSNWEITMPPIYSVEMDAADFRGLVSDQWHVGVRTSHADACYSSQPLLVLVQNPSPKVSRAAVASGYLPLYALASYVLYSAPNGVPTAVQGGVYVVGAGGQGGFYPTWVAA